jgi:hypothetical protein
MEATPELPFDEPRGSTFAFTLRLVNPEALSVSK